MAQNTASEIRNLVIYSIYVRNHSPEGTFAGVEADLPRLKALGVDVVWFLPIHPIGQLNKKGSLGCPYSIKDYRDVNPEYGSKQDFASLIRRAHALGLKVMIDVVYNHTSHDSLLLSEHPEFFHQDAQGHPVTTVPDWSDVIDLKHPHPGLTRYLVDSLVMWAEFGVDGFRCDVASLLPQEFWIEARQAVAAVKPGVIWLAESVHASFVEYRRGRGLSGISDHELYAAFDICYDYDIWPLYQQAVQGKLPPARYLEALRFQRAIYPANFAKLRCAENHDQMRVMRLAPSRSQALAWTALLAFCQGPFLIYGGQESEAEHTPSLFDVDKINWRGYPLADYLTRLAGIKKNPAQLEGHWVISAAEPAVQMAWEHPTGGLYGVFNIRSAVGSVEIPLPDGEYTDLLNGGSIQVQGGQLSLPATACILRSGPLSGLRPFRSELLDYHVQAS